MSEVKCVLAAKATTGECPVWNIEEQTLYWVDIQGKTLNRFDPATMENRNWIFPEDIGSFAFREKGGIVAAMRSGFAFFNLQSGQIEYLFNPEVDKPTNIFNDGKCDRAGRFWAGTLYEPHPRNQPVAALYRLDPDLSCYQMERGIGTSNCLAWSPDNRTMYFGDSRRRTVWAYDFEIESGAITNRRIFLDVSHLGRPDGAAVDEAGGYWLAVFDSSRVFRFTSEGKLDLEIQLPVTQPTMVAFGGEHLDTLYVTSARIGLKDEQLAREPLAGGLFSIQVGFKGLPEPKFKA
jgi:L-arabinonolactonase